MTTVFRHAMALGAMVLSSAPAVAQQHAARGLAARALADTTRLVPAVHHAKLMIGAPRTGTIDLFFIETRAQMARLIGGRATDFAEPAARAVFLVTNPEWEPPRTRWLGESLEAHERRWRAVSRSGWRPSPDLVDHIEAIGCG